MKIPLYEQVYNSLFNDIKNEKLKSGDRVPSEKELADHFRVSRITSKKALEKLSQERLIQRVRGKGSFVANPLPAFNQAGQLTGETSNLLSSQERAEGKMIIGVVMPDFSDAYGAQLLRAIERGCVTKHSQMVLKLTHDQLDAEEQAIQSLLNLGVAGLIVFPVHGEFYNADLLRLVLAKFPLVLVDRYLKGIPACAVYTDNKKASQQLTDYLLDLGHQDIAFLSPPAKNTSTLEDRLQGFSMAFSQRDLSLNPDYQLANLFSTLPDAFRREKIKIDEETLRTFIEVNPDISAFIASEYNLALILRQVQEKLGKKTPQDYAIACFDSPGESLGQPDFTYIHQDEEAIGLTAVNLLLAQIEGQSVSLNNVVGFQLVEGKSTGSLAELRKAIA